MLIDTHCHLNDLTAFPEPTAEIEFAKAEGVRALIVVGVKPDEWERTLAICEAFSEVYCILGWHPNYTADYAPAELDGLAELLAHPKAVALGEIGLDYHWDYSPPERQRTALVDQLDLAERLDLPVVFHAREAYSDLLDVLEQRRARPYLFHCFSGSAEDALRAQALDAYFGVDGPITYRSAHVLRQLVSALPKNRVVLETDSPYMTPVPHRGKPNRPAYVSYVNRALAEVFSVSEAACAELTTQNAQRFFGILS